MQIPMVILLWEFTNHDVIFTNYRTHGGMDSVIPSPPPPIQTQVCSSPAGPSGQAPGQHLAIVGAAGASGIDPVRAGGWLEGIFGCFRPVLWTIVKPDKGTFLHLFISHRILNIFFVIIRRMGDSERVFTRDGMAWLGSSRGRLQMSSPEWNCGRQARQGQKRSGHPAPPPTPSSKYYPLQVLKFSSTF